MLSAEEFVAAATPWLTSADAPYPQARYDRTVALEMAPHIQQRCVTLADAPGLLDFLFIDEPVVEADAWAKATGTPEAVAVFRGALSAYERLSDWTADALKGALEQIGEQHGLKLGKAQAPVRVAVTGRTVGPPLFESLECLGREATLLRLRAAAAMLG
jgi:glutamyl-tRNA synthetase